MATGQTLLDTMEMLDQELQLQSGETDVTRGLLALNRAQDFFETLVSQEPKLLGDTIGTVATAASTESTAFPSSLLRLDKLQLLDSNSRPLYELRPIDEAGGHAPYHIWPLSLFNTATTGRPTHYWTDGRNIYWDPLPDAIHTVRWYGLAAKSDITAGGTFEYTDNVILPIAAFATKLMRLGIGESVEDIDGLATQIFGPVIKSLARFQRDRAPKLHYTRMHIT